MSQASTDASGSSPTPVQSRIIQGFGTLLGFELIGEVVTRKLSLPIPGPIIGLLLLFAFLKARSRYDLATAPDAIDATGVAQVATPLLRNLAILFVAPGVGVIQYADLFVQHGPAVAVVLIAALLATLTVTALVFVAAQSFSKRLSHSSWRLPSWRISSWRISSWRISSWRVIPASLDGDSDRYLKTQGRPR